MKLDLPGLSKLVAARNKMGDPALQAEFDSAIRGILGEPAAQSKMRRVVFYVVLGVFIFFAVVTGVIAVLATVKVITVDDKYLGLLWKAFITSLIPLVGWLIRELWRK